MHQNILWKEVLGATFLILFAAVGVAHVINPDWFTKHSGIRKGGEMLTEWNRLQCLQLLFKMRGLLGGKNSETLAVA